MKSREGSLRLAIASYASWADFIKKYLPPINSTIFWYARCCGACLALPDFTSMAKNFPSDVRPSRSAEPFNPNRMNPPDLVYSPPVAFLCNRQHDSDPSFAKISWRILWCSLVDPQPAIFSFSLLCTML